MVWNRIVLGIGNPGPEYENTRHNAGFMVLDQLASRWGLDFRRLERRGPDGQRRFGGRVKARIAEGENQQGEPFLMVKPLTYVNLSGEVAAPLLRFAELSPGSLFVIVDDLNLPLGRIRVRPSGSSGGHNGLKSIEQLLGTPEYPRLRLGIGPPVDSSGEMSEGEFVADATDFVLAPFLPEEREVLGRVLGRAADCVQSWLNGTDPESLMGIYNGMVDLSTDPGDSDTSPEESRDPAEPE